MAPAAVRAELIDNGNGTVTDTVSGLMWLKNANMNGPMNHAAATAWATGLTVGGHTGWRLPSGANRDGSGTVCNSAPFGANCTGTDFATLYFARNIMAGNPGLFQNLQYGSYWTATDNPANTAQAMAQDFIDGGQNPFAKSATLFAWAVRDAGPLPPGATLLYGIVDQAPRAGELVLIDTQNGVVTGVGQTSFTQACSLAFDRIRTRMYLSPCFGMASLQLVNLANGAATPLGTTTPAVRQITHRHIDDRIYGVDLSPALFRLDPQTGGSDIAIMGIINKQSVSGIATRRSDGRLFGIGFITGGTQMLFRLNPAAGSGSRDADIAPVTTSAPIRGLTFHPDGRLLASDGTRLLTIDPATGAVSSPRPFVTSGGAPFGVRIGALAASGPRLPAPPDVWLRDCPGDTGTVPSSPSPCTQVTRSPDIMVDNNGNGVPDAIVHFGPNIVRIRVRNRGAGPAQGAVVRLIVSGTPKFLGTVTLVGQRTVNVPRGGFTTVLMPWQATTAISGTTRCLGVLLDHPSDRANSNMNPATDNNKAVHCMQLQ
jgi:hypothetical protein